MADRTPPFCCSQITPQPPFHKQEHYPRSYTCLLDFLHLATSLRAGRLPPTTPTKPLTEHDFVVRLCKGHTNPQFGANQWGAARYFLPDSSVRGGLIEVLDVEDEDKKGGNELEDLRGLLSTAASGGKFGGFLYLEDVWMTVLCPMHRDAVWFLQFWVKGPNDNVKLGELKKRVRDRANGRPGFVEDAFTVRFQEMMGIHVRRPQEERVASPEQQVRQQNLDVRGMAGVDVEKWRDQAGGAEQRGHLQGYPQAFGQAPTIPPGLPPPQLVRRQRLFDNSTAEESRSPPILNTGVYQLGGNGMLEEHEAGPRNFPSRNQPHLFGAIGDSIPDRGYQDQDPPLGFLGTALRWEDPSLRAPITPQPFSPQPPPVFWVNQRPTSASAEPSRARTEHWQTTNLHSPQPARSFDVGGMWQSPEFPSAQPAHPSSFLQPQGPGWRPGPYDVYEPEQPIPSKFSYHQNSKSGLPNHNQGELRDVSWQTPLHSVHVNRPFFSHPPPSSPGCPLDPNDLVYDIPVDRQHELQSQMDGPPTAPAAMRDTSAAGKSAYAPPAGNTSGLRPVPRRTWDIAKKEWRTYWVWAL